MAKIEFFRHMRFADPKNNNLPHAKGGVVFYIRLNPEKRKFKFSVAFCSDKDNFNGAIGQLIALGRKHSGLSYTVKNYNYDQSILENIQSALHYAPWHAFLPRNAIVNRQLPYLAASPAGAPAGEESKLLRAFARCAYRPKH